MILNQLGLPARGGGKLEDFPPKNPPSYRPDGRIITRALLEYSTAVAVDLVDCFDGFFDVGIFYLTLLRSTGAVSRFRRGGASARRTPPHAISINALASSLERPFETSRQHALRLIAGGWCVQGAQGLSVPDAILDGQARDLLVTIHDRFVGLVEHLAQIGVGLPSAPRWTRARDGAVLELALELILKSIEIGTASYGGWTQMLIYTAVMTANARPITFNPGLAHRYADATTPPPEDVRSPVGIRALARAIHLPYPTVRRHVLAQVAEGRMIHAGGGVMISMAWLQRPDMLAQGELLGGRILEMVLRMAALGFPFNDAASARIGKKPPLADFR